MEPSEDNVAMLLGMGFGDEGRCRAALRMAKNDIGDAIGYLTDEVPGLDNQPQLPILPLMGPSPTASASQESQDPEAPFDPLEFPTTHLYDLENKVSGSSSTWVVPVQPHESLGRCLQSAIALSRAGLLAEHRDAQRFLQGVLGDSFAKLLNSSQVKTWQTEVQTGIQQMVYLLLRLAAELVRADKPLLPTAAKVLEAMEAALDPMSVYNSKNGTVDGDPRWDESVGGEESPYAEAGPGARKPRVLDFVACFGSEGGFEALADRFRSPDTSAAEMLALLGPLAKAAAYFKRPKMDQLLAPCVVAAFDKARSLKEAEVREVAGTVAVELLSALIRLAKASHFQAPVPLLIDIVQAKLSFILRLLSSAHFGARMQALKEISKILENLADPAKGAGDGGELGAEEMDAWLDENAVLQVALEGNLDQQQYCERLKTLLTFLGPRLKAKDIERIWALRRGRAAQAVDNAYVIMAQAGARFQEAELRHLLGLVERSWDKESLEGRERALRLLSMIGHETSQNFTVEAVVRALWSLTHKPGTTLDSVRFGWQEQLGVINKHKADDLRSEFIHLAMEDQVEGRFVSLALYHTQRLIEGVGTSFGGGRSGFRSQSENRSNLLKSLAKDKDLLNTLLKGLEKIHVEARARAAAETPRSSTPMGMGPSSLGRGSTPAVTPLPRGDLLLAPVTPAEAAGSARLEPDISPNLVLGEDGETFGDYLATLFGFLNFILREIKISLSWERLCALWAALMETEHSCPREEELCFQWLAENLSHIKDAELERLFREKVLKLSAERLPRQGFACFRKIFEKLNQGRGFKSKSGWASSSFPGEGEEKPLIGLDFLWELALWNAEPRVAEEAREMLIEAFVEKPRWGLSELIPKANEAFMRACFARFEALFAAQDGLPLGLSEAARALAHSAAASSTAVQPLTLRIPVEVQQSRVLQRLLHVLAAFLRASEELYHHAHRVAPPHAARCYGPPLNILVHLELESTSSFNTTRKSAGIGPLAFASHSNETLLSVRERLNARLEALEGDEAKGWSVGDQVTLWWGADELEPKRDSQTLQALGLVLPAQGSDVPGLELTAKRKNTYTTHGFDDEHGLARSAAHLRLNFGEGVSAPSFVEKEMKLPAVLLAANPAVFDLLHEMGAELGPQDLDIEAGVRDLLAQLPQEPAVATTLDSLFMAPDQVARSCFLVPSNGGGGKAARVVAAVKRKLGKLGSSGSGSTPPSPKTARPAKPGHSRTHSNASTGSADLHFPSTSEQRLQALFRLPGPKGASSDQLHFHLSPFRLLYHLEVLSSRLLPCYFDQTAWCEARDLEKAFTEAGGLDLLFGLLHREALPPSGVSPALRQEILDRVIQLLSFLLVGNSLPLCIVESERSELGASVGPAPVVASSESKESLGISDLQLPNPLHARKLTSPELGHLLRSLQGLAWASAAGCLSLRSGMELVSPSGGGNPFFIGSPRAQAHNRESESSSGSSNGGGAEGDAVPSSVHSGLQTAARRVSKSEERLAMDSLKLTFAVLLARIRHTRVLGPDGDISELKAAALFALPHFADFLLDLVFFCGSEAVRGAMAELCEELVIAAEEVSADADGPCLRLHGTLASARLPLWGANSCVRGASRRLVGQCGEFFRLRCFLLCQLPKAQFAALEPAQMLKDEVAWLLGYTCSTDTTGAALDSRLVAAHMRLIQTLLRRLGPDLKESEGAALVEPVLNEFLFPASKVLELRSGSGAEAAQTEKALRRVNAAHVRSSSGAESGRKASYDLLAELCRGCPANFRRVARALTGLHHQASTDLAQEWEHMPLTEPRSAGGYVGLKNAGATCYMNAVLQNLFMEPGVARAVLRAGEGEGLEAGTLLGELQRLFAWLSEAQAAWHEPKGFWATFRLWGEAVNLREQQDAFEFFTTLVDQADQALKALGRREVFKDKLQGLMLDQMICQGCPHTHEKEEAFYALNLPLHALGLEESLRQFVKGEILEGDNAYFCEACGERRRTQKRLSIRRLPPLLCLQLKRFGYDWEEGRPLKTNAHFPFPRSLDMRPYTAASLAQAHSSLGFLSANASALQPLSSLTEDDGGSDNASSQPIPIPPPRPSFYSGDASSERPSPSPKKAAQETTFASPASPGFPDASPERRQRMSFSGRKPSMSLAASGCRYELSGVVVHTGRVTAGHYYAFVRERRRQSVLSASGAFGKWLKFNDTTVEPVLMTDAVMENELFGGNFVVKNERGASSLFPENRERHWNAYLLFYSRVEEPGAPGPSRQSSGVGNGRSVSMSGGLKMPAPGLLSPTAASPLKVNASMGARHASVSFAPQASPAKPPPSPTKTGPRKSRQDSLGQLAALVEAGEAAQLFRSDSSEERSGLPPALAAELWQANLEFLRNRHLYSRDYHAFVEGLVDSAAETAAGLSGAPREELCRLSTVFATQYLLNLAWHSVGSIRCPPLKWVDRLGKVLMAASARRWLCEYLSAGEGAAHLRAFLFLEAGHMLTRTAFANLVTRALWKEGEVEASVEATTLLEKGLLPLVGTTGLEQWARSASFWSVLLRYARDPPFGAAHLLSLGAFPLVLDYLLVPKEVVEDGPEDAPRPKVRRWSLNQAKELQPVYALLSKLLVAAAELGSAAVEKEAALREVLDGSQQGALVRELLFAYLEVPNVEDDVSEALQRCLVGRKTLTQSLLWELLSLTEKAALESSAQTDKLAKLLPEVINVEDGCGEQRAVWLLNGVAEGHAGLLDQIQATDEDAETGGKRRYTLIKLLVLLAQQCPDVRDALQTCVFRWHWAVEWLTGAVKDAEAPPAPDSPSKGSFGGGFSGASAEPSKSFLRTTSVLCTLEKAQSLMASSQPPSPDRESEEGEPAASQDASQSPSQAAESPTRAAGSPARSQDDDGHQTSTTEEAPSPEV